MGRIAVALALLVAAGPALAETPGASSSPPTGPRDPGGFSVSAEALVWWLKGSPAPTPLVSDGFLDDPGTKVFLGGEDLDTNPNPGLRVTLGYALDRRWGVEGSVFYLPTRSTTRSVSSSGLAGSQNLLIPFFDPTLHRENVTGLSAAGDFSGSAREELSSSFLGAELSATRALVSTPAWRVDLLGGFRYLRLRETYAFSTSSPFVPPQPLDIWETKDEFDATNNFYGAQLGVRCRLDRGPWFVGGVVKLALGAMAQSVDIDGFLLTNDFNGFGAPQRFAGGYFAQPTNIGTRDRTVFAVVPEVGLTLGYRLCRWASVSVGYTFLYVSDVARPGLQVDRTINPTQSASFGGTPPTTLQGPAHPAFKFEGSDVWAQGINFGLTLRF
jgi:hypothetical protein